MPFNFGFKKLSEEEKAAKEAEKAAKKAEKDAEKANKKAAKQAEKDEINSLSPEQRARYEVARSEGNSHKDAMTMSANALAEHTAISEEQQKQKENKQAQSTQANNTNTPPAQQNTSTNEANNIVEQKKEDEQETVIENEQPADESNTTQELNEPKDNNNEDNNENVPATTQTADDKISEAQTGLFNAIDEQAKAGKERLDEFNKQSSIDQEKLDKDTRFTERVARNLFELKKSGQIDDAQFKTLLIDELATRIGNIGAIWGALAGVNLPTGESMYEKISKSDLKAALERREEADKATMTDDLKRAEYTTEQQQAFLEWENEAKKDAALKPFMAKFDNAQKIKSYELLAQYGEYLDEHPEMKKSILSAVYSNDPDKIAEVQTLLFQQDLNEAAKAKDHDRALDIIDKNFKNNKEMTALAQEFQKEMAQLGVDLSVEQAQRLMIAQIYGADAAGELFKDKEINSNLNSYAEALKRVGGTTRLESIANKTGQVSNVVTSTANNVLDIVKNARGLIFPNIGG